MADPLSALIITAELGPADFSQFQAERTRHYPPERNIVPAHLTMFHALPPSSEEEVRRRLAIAVQRRPPPAVLAGMINLGNGVAYAIASDELQAIREELVEHFHGMLTAQDSARWRPHITIQNKVDPSEARSLHRTLLEDFRPRPIVIHGLALHRYLGGPWEGLARYPFRGS